MPGFSCAPTANRCIASRCRAAPVRRTPALVCRASAKPPLSRSLLAAIKHSRQQAARHGCLFVNVDHLALGLLQTPCEATEILRRVSLDFETLKSCIDEKVFVPVNPRMEAGDVDLSVPVRDAIMYAQECAQEQGHEVAGTQHLAVVLINTRSSSLCTLLEARSVKIRPLEDELLASWSSHPEDPSQHMASGSEQVSRLREAYARMTPEQREEMRSGLAAKDPGAMQRGVGRQLTPAEEDDIYN